MHLTTVRVPLYTGGPTYAVRSALGCRPVVGDTIRYPGLLEVVVERVTLDVGAGGAMSVDTAPVWPSGLDELTEALSRLRFRPETPIPA